ncbi:MAG TPA: DUF308 domain-containing protein [Sorangium sp.]|nr:DUF308 domain-containing protein [Sorangium sp.]
MTSGGCDPIVSACSILFASSATSWAPTRSPAWSRRRARRSRPISRSRRPMTATSSTSTCPACASSEAPVRTTSFGLGLVDAPTVQENRGSFLGLGIALLVIGVLAILLPVVASLVSAVAIGSVLVVSGLLQGVHAVRNPRWANSSWSLASALFQIVAGVLIVAFPVTGTMTLTLILAAFFFADGLRRRRGSTMRRGTRRRNRSAVGKGMSAIIIRKSTLSLRETWSVRRNSLKTWTWWLQ